MEHPDLLNEVMRSRIQTLRRDAERARMGRRVKRLRRPLPPTEPTER
jgi:hypothetical protein